MNFGEKRNQKEIYGFSDIWAKNPKAYMKKSNQAKQHETTEQKTE